jgi:hypothetical protein
MLTSGRVVYPGWLAAGPVTGTEAGDTVEMEVEVYIKTNRSSHCRATGCAVGVVDRRRFGRSSWRFVSFGSGALVGILFVAGWYNDILD